MKRGSIVAVAVVAALATAGAILASSSADKNRIGLALDGPKNDHSFRQAHYIGLTMAAQKYKLKASVVDNLTDPQAQLDAVRNLAQDNGLVIGGGAEFAKSIDAAAKAFSDVQFVVSAGVPKPAANAHFVLTDWTGPGYVAGYLAAKFSKSGRIGFVGGALIPPTIQGRAGFMAGAKAANPKIKVATVIVGSFIDPQKAKAASAAQIAAGADVLYAFLDSGFAGLLKAISESGKDVKTIGVILPQCSVSKTVVADTLSNIPQLVVNTVRDYRAGKLTNKVYGIEDPSVQSVAMCPPYATAKYKNLIKSLAAQIGSGKIKLPKT
ncbi:MAG TPA: BMP family ABC transporter substrate-binding protein [Gaiellaceae bacterium]|nr:BMP family ABC transporter substrate-binding protein [Gaiellaceae bacterium]